jgi:hypothetical protein
MPDITMCNAVCPFSDKCKRHPDSGTRPGPNQSWGLFIKHGEPDTPKNCDGWWPIGTVYILKQELKNKS